MATITQTGNANSVWNGTVPFDADPSVTHIVLYAGAIDNRSAYRRIKEITNSGPGPNAFGPLSYAQLGLVSPHRNFFLRATAKRGTQEDDLVSAANPALPVTASEVKGWTLEQLLEQGVRPVVVVGYDPVNNLYYPLNVVADGAEGYKLKI